MEAKHVIVIQRNHKFLKEFLIVEPVLDALLQDGVFTQEDYDNCRQAGPGKCEILLEIMKKKGVEGYRTLCGVLDSTQLFIKERLDATSLEGGPKLQLDATRANTDWCHVTTDGELVNSPPASQHRHSGRLRKYQGTCASTPIPLPPSPSTVTPVPHTPRYWETHSRVGVVGGGWGWPVLEMGVVEESQVDSEWYVCLQRRSWCVSVWSCSTHRGSICTRVWQQGKRGKCYSNTMSNTPGTQATLHYGVVLDVARGRLAFIDLNREVVLAKVDVEWSESLLPVSGVGLPDDYTVNMKVISGVDITMTDTKKSLIYDALN